MSSQMEFALVFTGRTENLKAAAAEAKREINAVNAEAGRSQGAAAAADDRAAASSRRATEAAVGHTAAQRELNLATVDTGRAQGAAAAADDRAAASSRRATEAAIGHTAAQRGLNQAAVDSGRAQAVAISADDRAAASARRATEALVGRTAAQRDLNAAVAAQPAAMNDNVGAGASRAVAARRQVLGYQAFDIGQGLALGTPMAMIAAQQGPQIAQLYAAQGGLNALWKDTTTILGGLVRAAGPWIAAGAALYGVYRVLASYTADAAVAIDSATAALAAQAAPIGVVKSGISELERLQRTYQEAIRSTGDTQSATSEKIIANTKREFDARKALMELEAIRQEAAIRANTAAIAQEGLNARRVISGDTGPWYWPLDDGANSLNTRLDLERRGFADPRIGSVPFVRLPDDLTGIERTQEVIENSPVFQKIRELRAEGELTRLTYEGLQEALKATFDDGSLLPGGSRSNSLGSTTAIPIPSFRGIDDMPGELEFMRDLQRATEARIKSLGDEQRVLGLTGAAASAFRYEQEAINAAIAKNISLSPGQLAAIEAQADAYGRAEEALSRARLAQDVQFERDQLARSERDQKIAAQLRSAGVDVDLDSQLARELRVNEVLRDRVDIWKDIRKEGMDAYSDIFDLAFDGAENWQEGLLDIGKNIAKSFVDLSVKNPFLNERYPEANLPTLGDVGGAGGFVKTLLGLTANPAAGAAGVSSQSVGQMTVTAGVVTIGGVGSGGAGDAITRLLTGTAANDNATLPTSGRNMELWKRAISSIESGSFAGNYSAIGPVTRNGDRAYGRYQVMGNNIPSWTRQALGEQLSAQQFLRNPAAQDAVFEKFFGGSVRKFGTPQDAASVWFTGRPINAASRAAFDVTGTTGSVYVDKFNRAMERAGGSASEALTKFGGAAGNATGQLGEFGAGLKAGLGEFGQGLGELWSNLGSFMQSANGGGSSWFKGLSSMFGGAGGALGHMMSISPAATMSIIGAGGGFTGLFDRGGYTGHGPRDKPAGIVHAGEVVWSQDDVSRAGGVHVVEAMRLGRRGYAGGGYVEGGYALPAASSGGVRGHGAPTVAISFENRGTPQRVTEEREEDDGRGGRRMVYVLDDMVSDVIGRPGSRSNRSLKHRGARAPLVRS